MSEKNKFLIKFTEFSYNQEIFEKMREDSLKLKKALIKKRANIKFKLFIKEINFVQSTLLIF